MHLDMTVVLNLWRMHMLGFYSPAGLGMALAINLCSFYWYWCSKGVAGLRWGESGRRTHVIKYRSRFLSPVRKASKLFIFYDAWQAKWGYRGGGALSNCSNICCFLIRASDRSTFGRLCKYVVATAVYSRNKRLFFSLFSYIGSKYFPVLKWITLKFPANFHLSHSSYLKPAYISYLNNSSHHQSSFFLICNVVGPPHTTISFLYH